MSPAGAQNGLKGRALWTVFGALSVSVLPEVPVTVSAAPPVRRANVSDAASVMVSKPLNAASSARNLRHL